MRRFALIVLLSVFASFLGLDGRETAPAAHAAFAGGNGKLLVRDTTPGGRLASVEPDGSDFRILGAGFNGSWSPDGGRSRSTPPARASTFRSWTPTAPTLSRSSSDRNTIYCRRGPRTVRRIVFSSNRGLRQPRHGWRYTPPQRTAQDVVQLTDWDAIAVEGNDPPKWSPDGSKILFIGQETPAASFRAEANPTAEDGRGAQSGTCTRCRRPAAG